MYTPIRNNGLRIPIVIAANCKLCNEKRANYQTEIAVKEGSHFVTQVSTAFRSFHCLDIYMQCGSFRGTSGIC